jgi:adenosylcobinamide-phosphate synthase
MKYVTGSLIAVVLGFVADLIFGDPSTPLHPICLIGNLIAGMERWIRGRFEANEKGELAGGRLLVFLVTGISTVVPALLLLVSYRAAFWFGVAVEAVMCFFIFAVHSLRTESMKVADALRTEGLEAGR